jgi:hypothetical protein
MTSGDVIVTVLSVGVVQILTMAFGFGRLFQKVSDHSDRLDRLEEHEDANRAAWPGRPHSSG